MDSLKITTSKPKEIIDITDEINQQIDIDQGIIHLTITHTTAALTTADLDPDTDQDYLDAFKEIIPALDYRHPHDPSHAPDHILSSIIGPSLTLPIENEKLMLGTWQRVIVVELNATRANDRQHSGFTPISLSF